MCTLKSDYRRYHSFFEYCFTMFVVKRAKSRKELFVLPKIKGLFGESILCMQNRLGFALQEIVEVFMLQIKKLN